MTNDRIIGSIAARQCGAFHLHQAVAAGVPKRWVARRAAAGAYLRLHPSVYIAGPIVHLDGIRWAAALAGGSDALITGEAAEDVWGLGRWPSRAVDIVVPRRQLIRLLREASFRSIVDYDRLVRTMARNGNRSGAAKLRRAVQLHLHGHGGTDSRHEDRFARRLERAGVANIVTGHVISVHGVELRVDVWLPDERLVVEVDPPNHLEAPMLREDALRSALLRSIDLPCVRVQDDDAGVDRVLDTIAFARRGHTCP